MDLKTLVLILPIIFMIHDFEEIIFFKDWLNKNEIELNQRFPKLAKKLIPHFKKLSTSSFAIGVAEEFLLISLISVFAAINQNYKLWYGIFIGFSIHIIIHILQWLIYRKYIPSIITSFIVLPYCIYTFMKINELKILTQNEKIIWSLIGLIIVYLNLFLVHKLIGKIESTKHNN